MESKSIKTAIFAFAVVAACFSGYKAYDSYTVNESTLMSANIEALSQDNGDVNAKAASKCLNSLILSCCNVVYASLSNLIILTKLHPTAFPITIVIYSPKISNR